MRAAALILAIQSFLKSRFRTLRSRYAYMSALSTASAAVRNNLLRPPRNPLANFKTFFLRLLALKPLLTRINFLLNPYSNPLSIGKQQFKCFHIGFVNDLTLP